MKKLISLFILSALSLSILASCNLFRSNATDTQNQVIQPTPNLIPGVTIQLVVKTGDTTFFDTVGQIITYRYRIRNTGTTSTPGPITATGLPITCPEINTVGNLDDLLDPEELIVCTATYTVTQADLDLGTITHIATAFVNGIASEPVTTTLTTTPPTVLSLTKTANPVIYNSLGQPITYTYVITNIGSDPLGPVQFVVSDPGLSALINCGDPALTLAPAGTVTCSAIYTITQADMDVGLVSTSATASGEGLAPSLPAGATITKDVSAPTPPGLVVGSTITHKVAQGEWLWQIARCYGADPKKVSAENPQLPNPAEISPGMTVTVPNIGSDGTIYGPPCVGTHIVQATDTWDSIAQTYRADVTVLQMANKHTLTVGDELVIPLNSAK